MLSSPGAFSSTVYLNYYDEKTVPENQALLKKQKKLKNRVAINVIALTLTSGILLFRRLSIVGYFSIYFPPCQ